MQAYTISLYALFFFFITFSFNPQIRDYPTHMLLLLYIYLFKQSYITLILPKYQWNNVTTSQFFYKYIPWNAYYSFFNVAFVSLRILAFLCSQNSFLVSAFEPFWFRGFSNESVSYDTEPILRTAETDVYSQRSLTHPHACYQQPFTGFSFPG